MALDLVDCHPIFVCDAFSVPQVLLLSENEHPLIPLYLFMS